MTRKTFLLALALGALTLGSAQAGKKPTNKPTAAKGPIVVITTSLGTIKAELNPGAAPLSVKNFLDYVNDKFYDGTVFHRVISGFMIQGGGFDANLAQKPTKPPVKNEAANGLKNLTGTLAMARTSIPDSATSQFYINVADNSMLDFRDPSPGGIGYCVFGKVTEGMDVVNKIKAVPTGRKNGMGDVPATAVTIQSIRLAGK